MNSIICHHPSWVVGLTTFFSVLLGGVIGIFLTLNRFKDRL